jgi:hypothetical protein
MNHRVRRRDDGPDDRAVWCAQRAEGYLAAGSARSPDTSSALASMPVIAS